MSEDSILVQRNQGGQWAKVIFNRPERMNALNQAMMDRLVEVMAELTEDAKLRVIVFSGAGAKAFCAGGDIGDFKSYTTDRASAQGWHDRLDATIGSVYNCPIPTLAMVGGAAMGAGCEIAIACDLRIVSTKAKFGIPVTKLGFPIPYFNAARLVALVGPTHASKIVYTGEPVRADEALRIGLANEIVEPDMLEDRTEEIIQAIISKAPLAQRGSKQTIRDVTIDPQYRDIVNYSDLFVDCYLSEDMQEGIAAFLEKRTPRFIGS